MNNEASSYDDGNKAEEVKSINTDDINRVTGYNPEKEKYGVGYIVEYGNKVTYKLKNGKIYYKGTKMPMLTPEDDEDGLESSETVLYYLNGDIWTSLANNESVTLENTVYAYTGDIISTESLAYSLLFSNTFSGDTSDYWLASPYMSCYVGRVCFGCRQVSSGYITAKDYSVAPQYLDVTEKFVKFAYGLRPVVTLKSEVQVTSEGVLSMD